MKFKHLFLLPLLLLITASTTKAIVLRGTVSEVRDGQTIIVTSGGRQLLVVLKGVAAPEMKQEVGDLARQHLSSLILNKYVEVDFTEFRSGQISARVYYGVMDVALQLIRDGAAWYDKNSGLGLTDPERRVYAEAEQTAHNEMRGIWQDGSPMPPWEWRRAQAAKSTARGTLTIKRAPSAGLRSEDLLASGRAVSRGSAASRGQGSRAVTGKPTAKPFNQPGQDADLSPYLTQGRNTIVYLYADWCPACRQMTPMMDAINSGLPDTQVIFMNIGNWGTPVAQRYGVTSIPYMRIYDKNGNLAAEGQSARTWMVENLGRR